MKKITALLILAAVVSASNVWAKPKKEKAAKEQVVIVGTEGAYPPYNFINKQGDRLSNQFFLHAPMSQIGHN